MSKIEFIDRVIQGLNVHIVPPLTIDLYKEKEYHWWLCFCGARKIPLYPEKQIPQMSSDCQVADRDGAGNITGYHQSLIQPFQAVLCDYIASLELQKGLDSDNFSDYARHTISGLKLRNKDPSCSSLYKTVLTFYCELCDRPYNFEVTITNPLRPEALSLIEAYRRFPLKDTLFTRECTARWRMVQGYGNVSDLKLYLDRLLADYDKLQKDGFPKTLTETFDTMIKTVDFQSPFPEDRFRRLKAGAEATIEESRLEVKQKLEAILRTIYEASFVKPSSEAEKEAEKLLGPLGPIRPDSHLAEVK